MGTRSPAWCSSQRGQEVAIACRGQVSRQASSGSENMKPDWKPVAVSRTASRAETRAAACRASAGARGEKRAAVRWAAR